MLKKLAIAGLFTLALTPAAMAEVMAGKVQSVNPAENTVSVQTADGATRTYKYVPGTIEAAKISEGSNVLVNPMKANVGTVVDCFRNYMRVRPDTATDDKGEFIVQLFPPPRACEEGERIAVLPDGEIVSLDKEIAGYLIPGEIVQAVEVAAIPERTSTEQRTTVIQRRTTEVTQPLPVSAPEPVRALW